MYREANMCANSFANIWCSLDFNLMIYELRPTQISDLCVIDMAGISLQHMIVV
jgi:hypothetical protein